MKPLILRDVALDIGMHESTISRVTMNKYIHRNDGDSDHGDVFTINPSCRTSLEVLDLGDALYSEGCFMWVEPDRIGNFFHRD